MKAECRPFQISDAMILIAVLGVGLAWCSSFTGDKFRDDRPDSIDLSSPLNLIRSLALYFNAIGPPIMAPVTFGLLVIRLRRPRPGWRRLGKQPGMIASLIVVGVWWLCAARAMVIGYSALVLDGQAGALRKAIRYYLTDYPATEVGLCVGVAWSVQSISRSWRPSRCWIDKLGVAAGILWIISYINSKYILGFLILEI